MHCCLAAGFAGEPRSLAPIDVQEDEEFLEQADQYEAAYNFRWAGPEAGPAAGVVGGSWHG